MSVSITPQIQMTAVRTATADAADDIQVLQSGFNLTGRQLNASSTPPVTMESYHTYALVAGAKTIDLTAILDALGVSQTAVGLKLQTLIIKNPAGNNKLTIGPGGSNPYPLFGTGLSAEIPGNAAGDSYLAFVFPEGLPDVASGVKNILVSGTGTETFYLGICLG